MSTQLLPKPSSAVYFGENGAGFLLEIPGEPGLFVLEFPDERYAGTDEEAFIIRDIFTGQIRQYGRFPYECDLKLYESLFEECADDTSKRVTER